MSRNLKAVMLCLFILVMNGCATHPQKQNYANLRTESPHSILVVPVINRSVEVNASDYLLSTISVPLAERGYYVFPVHLVKRMMEDDGLGDADMVHAGEPQKLGGMFGADAVMYITINRWDARYIVFSTTVTVELKYVLKSASSGQTLWQNSQTVVYQPQNSNSNGGLAGLIAQAITAAVEKAAPNYVPLARQANARAIYTKGQGLPAGPYSDLYQKDQTDF